MPLAPLAISYVINIPDKALVTSLQAQYPNGIEITPVQAQSTYNYTPVYGYANVWEIWQGYNFSQFSSVEQFNIPQADGSTAPGYWVGLFVYLPAAVPAPTTTAPSPWQGQRYFVEGFEVPTLGGGGSGSGGAHSSRTASRSPGGFGFAYRSNTSTPMLHAPVTAVAVNQACERFYIKLRTLPSAEDQIWQCKGSVEAGAAVVATVTAGGVIKFYNKGNLAFPGTLLGQTTPLTPGTWYRIDVGYLFANASRSGQLFVWLNGTFVFQGTVGLIVGVGLGVQQNWQSSSIGDNQGVTHGLECDLDDWIAAAWYVLRAMPASAYSPYTPVFGDALQQVYFLGFDVSIGSRVQGCRPTGFGNGNAGWAGDYRELDNLWDIPTILAANTGLVSTTPNAAIAITTDYVDPPQGCPAFMVGVMPAAAPGGGTCQLGYQIGAGGISTTINVIAQIWSTFLYTITAPGTIVPPAIPSLGLTYAKDNSAFTQTIQCLMAQAELLGTWGNEDVLVAGPTFPPAPGLQNAPYRLLTDGTHAAPQALPNPGTVAVTAGIYNGNALGQDILAKLPMHWWWVRPLSGVTDGVAWYSSMCGAHGYQNNGIDAARMARPVGPTTSTSQDVAMRVDGPNASANGNAVQYQYVGFSDVAARYCRNGAFAHLSSLAGPVANPLDDLLFTPDWVFALVENNTQSGQTHYVRGPGHTGSQASLLAAVASANVLNTAQGVLNSLAAVHTDNPQTAYSAWRKNDGTATGVVDILTYTGDGTGNRNIAVALGGRSPLFAIVTPLTGASFMRDPSHTANNSFTFTGANSTTGIIGGDLNIVQVGTSLNALGVVYNLFVLAGVIAPGSWSPNPTTVNNPVVGTPAIGGGPLIVPVPTQPGPAGPFPPPPGPPAPLPPGCISFATALQELSGRLGDANGVHWTSAELQRYLLEALRTYNAFTLQARNRATFLSSVGVPFYDLSAVSVGLTPAYRAYTLKDQDLIADLEYAIQEPATATAWSGTAMFTLAELTQAITRRRDRFLRETGIILTRETTSVTPDAAGRVSFPSDVMTIRRAAWTTVGGVTTILNRDDEWAASAFNRAWPTATPPDQNFPIIYSIAVTPSLTIQLAPPPSAIGTLDTLSAVLGATLDPTVGVLLGVPDDFAWVVKWGVLADLFSQSGPAADPVRAAHCLQRWNQGVEAAKRAAVVLAAQISGVGVAPVNAVQESDFYNASWQNGTAAPTTVLLAGLNLVALSPVPNGAYTVTLDLVRNMPVPTALTDCLFSGGVATTSALLDYAEYLALFKEGPNQARAAAEDLLTSFLDYCGVQLALDFAQMTDRGPTMGQTKRDETIVPRLRALASGEGGAA